MNLAGKYKIAGEWWTVRYDNVASPEGSHAFCDAEKREIVLDKKSADADDLWHELMHAIEACFGLDIDHKDLQVVARTQWQVCQENPKVVAYLGSKT